ncbi:hypothetical protein C7I36_03695 [Zobellella taiwanensis]|jgi:integral membrane sensor domain MASE1|uniref:MASE1 domain-containing protein n=1 Tax=Zobellella taiwanensis TaxID=347535 RepID=A0A2P7R6J5_9GAMM|nr:hypothetical protein C7I36_03695 [Zobellella taiwanensis]
MNPIPGPVSLSAQALSGGILLRRNLVAALLYLLAGGLGITLTLSSGYASPIWPAAGVAVTVLLIWGRRCWPGIWLGAFLIDAATALSVSGLLLSMLVWRRNKKATRRRFLFRVTQSTSTRQRYRQNAG